MNTKRRREFQLRDKNGNMLARGILYDEGNCQVLWRKDTGWTAEQYATLNPMIDLMPNVTTIKLIEKEN